MLHFTVPYAVAQLGVMLALMVLTALIVACWPKRLQVGLTNHQCELLARNFADWYQRCNAPADDDGLTDSDCRWRCIFCRTPEELESRLNCELNDGWTVHDILVTGQTVATMGYLLVMCSPYDVDDDEVMVEEVYKDGARDDAPADVNASIRAAAACREAERHALIDRMQTSRPQGLPINETSTVVLPGAEAVTGVDYEDKGPGYPQGGGRYA